MHQTPLKAIREFIAQLPAHLELQVAMAQLQRKRFDALIKEGFTEAQALELCKHIFSGG